MLKKIAIVLSIIGITTITACKLEDLGDPLIVAQVETEFHLDMWESLDPSLRSFSLKVETIKEKDCLNYSVLYDFEQSYRELNISLNDITPPVDCIVGVGPATTEIETGYLSYGNHDLTIALQNTIISKGKLVVDNESFRIEMETQNGFNFLHKELRRIPFGSIWGYINYGEASGSAAAAAFVAELADQSEEKEFAPGYYGYFTINNSIQQVLITNRPVSAHFKSFLFNFTGSEEALEQMAESFRLENPEFELKIFMASGKEI